MRWSRTGGAGAVAVGVLALSACASGGGAPVPSTAGPSAASPSPTGSATPAPLFEDTSDPGVLRIQAEPFADWVTAADAGVWVANVGEGLTRYGDDGSVTGSVPTGSIDLAMETGFGALWAGADAGAEAGELVRVELSDPGNIVRIAVPPLAEESSVAVTEESVWVLTADRQLVRVDPVTNAASAPVPAPDGAAALRGGFGFLWVTLSRSAEVARLDPGSGAEVERIGVGAGPAFLAIGADAVWVMNQRDGTISRVDPETSSEAGTVDVGVIQGGDIAASDTAIWVRNTVDLAVAIDPAAMEVVRRIGPREGSGSIDIAADGAVWISAHDTDSVYRIPGERPPPPPD